MANDDPWGNDTASADPWGSGGGAADDGGDTDVNENVKGGGDNTCFVCKEEGHMSRDCPQRGPMKCFNCQEEGHSSKDCTKAETCRICKEEGHISPDCPKKDETRTITRDDGTTAEIYIPKEMDEDKLFESGIGSGINFDRFDKIGAKISGENPPKKIDTFKEANLRDILLENIDKSGYKKPTPIQKYAIPIVQAKRDLMGCAQTGSGKTAAFLLPILHTILENGAESNAGASEVNPTAVIVAPTRELAIQIKDEARKFAFGSMVRAVVAYGGTSTGFQMRSLFSGCHVLIATPGRLMDFVEKGKVTFQDVKYLVLDEADRMLDMGFMPKVREIVAAASMPAKGERQTLMFSATFPNEVQTLAAEFLADNYLFLSIGMVGCASQDVEQTILAVEKFKKRDKLTEILKEAGSDRTLVFVETKRNADFIATYLSEQGFPTTSIHGDRLQRERECALADFKLGRMPVLVATAVAARGLDIKGVKHVINYDLPNNIDEYVHRIGRTGRVGNTGRATSFYDSGSDFDTSIASDLVRILSDAQQEVPDFLQGAGSGGGGAFGAAGGFGGADIRSGAKTVEEEDAW